MSNVQMVGITAVTRTECVADLLHELRAADVQRIYVSRVHAVGAGLDPEDFKLSLEEGGAYTEKAKVEFVCPAARVEELMQLIRTRACTGHRGDGVIIASPVQDVMNIRTGDRGELALV